MKHSPSSERTPVLAGLPFEERLARSVDVGDCWEWKWGKPRGYGRLVDGGKWHQAHRWVYENLVGPIPATVDGDKAVLDHLCRNTACVNPDHLELVGNVVNVLRGFRNKTGQTCAGGHGPEHRFALGDGHTQCRMCKRETSRRIKSVTVRCEECGVDMRSDNRWRHARTEQHAAAMAHEAMAKA